MIASVALSLLAIYLVTALTLVGIGLYELAKAAFPDERAEAIKVLKFAPVWPLAFALEMLRSAGWR